MLQSIILKSNFCILHKSNLYIKIEILIWIKYENGKRVSEFISSNKHININWTRAKSIFSLFQHCQISYCLIKFTYYFWKDKIIEIGSYMDNPQKPIKPKRRKISFIWIHKKESKTPILFCGTMNSLDSLW